MADMEPLDQLSVDEPDAAESKRLLRTGDMGFLDHLDELRGVLIKSFAAFVVASAVLMIFVQQMAELLNWPLHLALGDPSDVLMRDGLITNGPIAVFGVLLQMGFFGGLALSLPFILYWIARFIAPGLNERELRLLRPILAAAFGLFLLGGAFAFCLLCPATLRASIFFNSLLDLQVLWTADAYYGFLVWSTLGVGVLFEFPLLIIALVAAGILTVAQLRQYRAHSIVAILTLAAMITPTTDPVTFLVLGIPMYALYEGAVLASARVERKRMEREAEEEAELQGEDEPRA